ncbi:MAG: DinB family protein [Erythrobacter sp.]|uniref:DinB family protein n=1 Tax=Erythrobacter sp. TaxID=1042 RepID=UPI002606C22C|nr:DinB family protein [Erythrobacter sp.]MDJ0978300.1 DinB family protein [Erythrobacter sp.]
MITSDYLRSMARYNRWQNDSLYEAAAGLSDADRRLDRGAFFGSIHGTLSHIYWADRIWLSRFDLCEPPDVPNRESARFVEDFGELRAKRTELDATLIEWCDAYEPGPIKGSLEWYSGAIRANAKAPLTVILTHLFNHQTHHRGQAHAMLTAAGARPKDTCLFIMPLDLWPEA